MSKGELWKGVAIRLITAGVFGVIGGFAIWYALQMVAIFGEGMGVDARSREIYAHSHMVVHVFGAACALAIGIFYHGRNWTLFALALLAIVGCGGYGILNMVGFTSTNRVTVAATKDAKKSAAERQYQNARADLLGQIDWLQKTAAQEDGRERRRLLSEVDTKRKELSSLAPPVPTAETVLSDAQASTLAELTDTSARKWLLALPVPLAVFVFMAESFSFIFVGHLLAGIVAVFATYYAMARKPAVDGDIDVNSNSGGDGSGNKGTNIVPLHPAEPSTPAIRADPASVAVAATPVVERPKSATPQRSALPVAGAPWSAGDVDAYLKQRPLMANPMPWRQLGAETGWNWNTLYKRGQRLTGQGKGKRVLGQHRQQHRHQEGNRAFV